MGISRKAGFSRKAGIARLAAYTPATNLTVPKTLLVAECEAMMRCMEYIVLRFTGYCRIY